MVLLKEVWPLNEFERFAVGEVNYFIRKFLEVFYFPSDFIVVAEDFKKGFVRSFSSK